VRVNSPIPSVNLIKNSESAIKHLARAHADITDTFLHSIVRFWKGLARSLCVSHCGHEGFACPDAAIPEDDRMQLQLRIEAAIDRLNR
jgi:hypothetical protein